MQSLIMPLAAGVLLAAGLAAAPAHAQVTLDPRALDTSPSPSPPATKEPAHPTHKRPPRKAAEKPAAASKPTPKPKSKPAEASAHPAAPANPPPAATLPTSVPPGVSLAPIVVQPPAGKQEPPPPPPIDATAGGSVEPIQGGLRVLFTPDHSDLTPETEKRVRAFAGAVPRTPSTSFNVTAFAAGPPQDPSTPRRLSLSRALAIRSILMAEGVPSEQIYVRALGTAKGDGPADRVDIVPFGTNAADSVAGPAKK